MSMATPRTDAEIQQFDSDVTGLPVVDAGFARQLERELHAAKTALLPLVAIAEAYDANALDDEARKSWGTDNEHTNTTPHDRIELYSGRSGKQLLTLADCMKAREIVYKDS